MDDVTKQAAELSGQLAALNAEREELKREIATLTAELQAKTRRAMECKTQAAQVTLEKGPNIGTLPELAPLPDRLVLPVLLRVGDDVSTDEILPAGARVLPFRSNIAEISRFAFEAIDPSYSARARELDPADGHAVIAGRNYGQGSSREHAALAPRSLGLRLVVAITFARIHWQNLANFGILALTFEDAEDHARVERGDVLEIDNTRDAIRRGAKVEVRNTTRDETYRCRHDLSPRQVEMVLAGGIIPMLRAGPIAPQA